ncbi:MAG: cytochrome c [Pyrinomonadaceae bacterium]|nr:cytochrome c [Acidobacteriota bacterium]MBP7376561.1 cytochrome c [Pyrinomonadaceae bacterium]
MNYIKLTVVLMAAALFAVACGQMATTPNTTNSTANNKPAATPGAGTPAPAATPEEIAMGMDLYAKNCAECHKDSGKGGKVTIDGKTLNPDDITTAKMAAKPDEKLTEYVVNGFPDDGMPAFKDKMTPEQIKAVIKHVRTLQKP